MRALAALSVVALHTWLYAAPGGPPGLGTPAEGLLRNLALGVTLFFTLSGFLLYRPVAAAILRDGRQPAIGLYLRARALRIFPAYWVILAVCGLIFATVNVPAAGGGLEHGALTDPLEFLGAALLIGNYRPDGVLVGIGPAWSLAVEAMFYLVLPVLGAAAAMAARLSPERRVLAAVAPALILLALGLSGKFAAGVLVPAQGSAEGWGDTWHAVIERSFWAQADLFSFGMLLAVARVRAEDGLLRVDDRVRRLAIPSALVLLAACAVSLRGDQLSYRPENTLVALACAILVAHVVLPKASGEPSRCALVLEARPLAAVGLASYSLFLWHEPLVHWLAARGLTATGWAGVALNLALVLALAGVLSAGTYRLVEAPALRRGRRADRARSATQARVTRTERTRIAGASGVVAAGASSEGQLTSRFTSGHDRRSYDRRARRDARSARTTRAVRAPVEPERGALRQAVGQEG